MEIETENSSRAIENIRKNLEAGFDTVSVITPNHKVRKAIESQALRNITTKNDNCIRFPTMSFYDM